MDDRFQTVDVHTAGLRLGARVHSNSPACCSQQHQRPVNSVQC